MIKNKSNLTERISFLKNCSGGDFFDENYLKIKEFNNAGKKFLNQKSPELAYEFFKKAGNINACAYCKMLEGDIKSAEFILNLAKDSSPFGNWLLFIIALIQNKYPKTTYFQVRNFYEQDLEMLFLYERTDFIKNLTDKNAYIEKFNREIYKYTARVLLNNNIYDQAEEMLKKSCEICYNDPETHYMKGEIELQKGNKEAAIKEFKISADITGDYKPATEKLKTIK